MFSFFLQIFPWFSFVFCTLFGMKYIFLEEVSIPDNISFWQSTSWRAVLLDSWQATEVFYYGNISGTWMLVEIRSIWLGQFGAFSLGVSRSQISDDLNDFIDDIKKVLLKKWVIFFQIEPLEEIHALGFSAWKHKPYKKFITPYTRILDLSLSEDELLSQMHEKGRYNIRLSERRGVTVNSVEATDENIDIWMNLLCETTSRDGFSKNSRKYYVRFINELSEKHSWGLYFAFHEWKVIAAGIFVFTRERAIYYYGASSWDKETRKHMAPYLLQWTVILEAKKRGIPLYDFLGVADPRKQDDELRWVTDFKEKFGGTLVQLPQKLLFPISWKYRIFSFVRRVFKGFR